MERYDRSDVLRILRITARQLAGWEKAGLLPAAESYSFFDLLQIKKMRDLRAKRVRSAVILESLRAMRQVAGMENPMMETGTFASQSRVVFRHQGSAVEPLAGQFVMDFNQREVVESHKIHAMRAAETASEFFARGVALEEDPGTQAEAIDSYKKCVDLDPTHAAAYINLGTLFYNRHDYVQAEHFYRKAIEVDPRYALAYFDLGNVLDETGRLPDAIQGLSIRHLAGPHLRRRALQPGVSSGKSPPAAQGPESLGGLYPARYRRAMVNPRPQPDQKNPGRG